MGKRYPRTDETYDVLRQHTAAIAREYPCRESYISAMRDDNVRDPFAHFEHVFLSATRAGAPVAIWLRKLNGHVERVKRQGATKAELAELLPEKVLADADETSKLLEAIGDHELDKALCHKVLAAIEIDTELNDGIRRLMEARLSELSNPLKAVG